LNIHDRQQTLPISERKDTLAMTLQILKEEGISGLWKGLNASLILCINPAITYGVFEKLKSIVLRDKKTLSAWDAFVVGALAKALATIITCKQSMAQSCRSLYHGQSKIAMETLTGITGLIVK
jgi:adenine nucleotide transporter 17